MAEHTYKIIWKRSGALMGTFFNQRCAKDAWAAYCGTFFKSQRPRRRDYQVRRAA